LFLYNSQEYGNVPYVVKGGFGVYTGNRPTKIANTISNLFSDEDKLAQMSMRAKMLSHPEATMSIARDIGETVLTKPVKTIRML
jgi:UDP-N-acetylglucosamine:LPS N-acetylglucosamine transferase